MKKGMRKYAELALQFKVLEFTILKLRQSVIELENMYPQPPTDLLPKRERRERKARKKKAPPGTLYVPQPLNEKRVYNRKTA